jgi:hypothetical protein
LEFKEKFHSIRIQGENYESKEYIHGSFADAGGNLGIGTATAGRGAC